MCVTACMDTRCMHGVLYCCECRGAAVDVKNKKGNTPLWLACNGMFTRDCQTVTKFKSLKLREVELLMELRLTATECHLPYGITQCYLLPDISEHTPP